MTAQPVPDPAVPDTAKAELAAQFTRILTLRYGTAEPQVVTALVLAASSFASARVEQCARPDGDRWKGWKPR